MAVPKKRKSSARRDERRSHDALKASTFIYCSECGESMLPHKVCMEWGFYKGRQVLKVKSGKADLEAAAAAEA